ncbi:hypothetical protein R3W88_019679 [Solanum pinnatisectum]|uniref:Uncharacterized protein n=1 Tax=Solanum pinnatisectum TaxID=50273 RepID=A0AAV9KNX0_9SOLN|nr:hypothetical protein R3W88_019679 [Solanum pinnatisectum]
MESSKLRKKNYEAKYPTWDQFYDNLSTHQLKQIAASVEAKIELIKQRILEGNAENIVKDMQAMSYVGKQTTATPQPCVMQSLVRKNSLQLEIIEEQQQPIDVPPTMNFPAEMMMINTDHVNNNNNIVENQLGGMQGMMRIDQNMLFDDHPQPMCYFVPVVTPTNYFHHHHQ